MHLQHKLRTALLTSALISSAVLPSVAQDGSGYLPPSTSAVQFSNGDGHGVVVDGLLDDEIWRNVPVATDFRQREPTAGAPATERTEVRILYDESTLYVGIMAYDSDPDGIIARILQRDEVMTPGFFGGPGFGGDDGVAILFDTFHDHRNGMIFATNPNGAEFDALITDEGRETNIDWRAVWRVAAQRVADGWSAEFAIPFRTLRYPVDNGGQPWGFNVYRVIRRKNEEVLWSSWSRQNEGFGRVSRAGHLEGLDHLPHPGMNLEVKPYVLGGVAQQRLDVGSTDADPETDVGVDAKWEVQPGLLLDLTVNTDFAQVEADDQQVNLTRFNLFFPEKRDFFLENSGIFDYGDGGFFGPPPYLVFFSRRIGLSSDGVVPILGGARLNGRVGGQTVGFLNVVTDRAFNEPRTNFAVARLKRDVGENNYIGAIFTDRRNDLGWNSTAGADWSFWPTSRLNFAGFVSGTATDGPGGEGSAYKGDFDYTSDKFGFNIGHLAISPDARADMGFITRTDIRSSAAFFRYSPRPQVLGLRKIDLRWSSTLVTHTDWTLQDWSLGPTVAPQWNSGEDLSVDLNVGFTRLDQGFDIGPNVPVPAGDYDTWSLSFMGGTSSNRPVVLDANASMKGIYEGTIGSVGGSLSASPNANLSFTVSYNHNHVDVPSGSFNADIGRLRLLYAFSTRLFFNALIQYNSLDDRISANVRLNFIHTPGSDLFIVVNEERGVDGRRWDLVTRSSVIKLTYLARL
jgi:Domain of unknown function (DUF5916)